MTSKIGVAELWDDFAQLGTDFQWFQPPIHPAFMQRPKISRSQVRLFQFLMTEISHSILRVREPQLLFHSCNFPVYFLFESILT